MIDIANSLADEAHKVSQLRLPRILEAAHLGVWELDLANDASIRSLQHDQIFGYSSLQPEWGFHTLLAHVVPEDADLVKKQFAEALHTDRLELECRIRWPDKSVHWVALVGTTFRNDKGTPVTMMGTIQDITVRMVAEDDLRLKEEWFHLMVENVTDYVTIMLDTSGRVLNWNRVAEQIKGYREEEIIGTHFSCFYTREDREAGRPDRDLESAMATGRSEFEGWRVRKDGSKLWATVVLMSMRDRNGMPRGFAMVARDMTAKRRAIAQFRGLMESAPDAMVVVNEAGNIFLVNAQTEKLFGYRREELLGKPADILFPKGFLEKEPAQNTVSDPERGGLAGESEQLHGRRKDGTEFPIEITLGSFDSTSGTLLSAAIRDISERVKIDQILRDKNVELGTANQAKDRFLATMSHELRTPLNAIIGFTGTLLMRLPGPLNQDQEKQLRVVQGSGKHLLSLINDMLDLAKIESGKIQIKLERQNWGEVLEEVATTLRPSAELKGLKFETAMGNPETFALADRRALSQILINLTTNAIKFTEKGSVRLELSQRSDNGSTVTEFNVVDTGVGIVQEDQTKLFQAFARVGSEKLQSIPGTGLGLHLSQKLAELLGSQITVQSELGKGSRFTLRLRQEHKGQPQ